MKNEPDPKEQRKDVVESHLYYADPLKGNNEKFVKSIKLYERAHEAHENNRGVAHDKLTDSKQFYYRTKEDSLKQITKTNCFNSNFYNHRGVVNKRVWWRHAIPNLSECSFKPDNLVFKK